MIVLPTSDERASRGLARYLRQRYLAERSNAPMEAAVARGLAAELADRHRIVETELRAYVPDPAEARVAGDGFTLLVHDTPWWRGMLAIILLDRVGVLHDAAFSVSEIDAPWEFDPETGDLGDFVVRVVGTAQVVGTVLGLFAATSLHLVAKGAIRVEPPVPHDRLAFFLGGLGGVMDALGEHGRALRADAERKKRRTALVRWSPPRDLFRVDPGEIDMHSPNAHVPEPEDKSPVVVEEAARARLRGEIADRVGAPNPFRLGAHAGYEVVMRMLKPNPLEKSRVQHRPILGIRG